MLGEPVRLTTLAKAAGCAAKIGPGQLADLLQGIGHSPDPRLLVGFEHSDDAGVFQLTPELAIVQTVDFFTPMVDDPYTFGQIAAANAISDVYAMGGEPLTALNILAVPLGLLGPEVVAAILRGGADKAAEAGVAIIGGHTIENDVPTYGLAVMGTIRPDRITRNSGGQPGDRLILTKPIGVGIIATALKFGTISLQAAQPALDSMATLNQKAGRVLTARGAHACTDITGFGLLGHLWEMCRGAGIGADIAWSAVPVFDGVLALAEADEVPGGAHRNLAFVQPHTHFDPAIDTAKQLVLADPQTSGGLLFAVTPENGEKLHRALKAAGVRSWEIGRLTSGDAIRVGP